MPATITPIGNVSQVNTCSLTGPMRARTASIEVMTRVWRNHAAIQAQLQKNPNEPAQ